MKRRVLRAVLLFWGLSLWACPWTEADELSEIQDAVVLAKQVLVELPVDVWARLSPAEIDFLAAIGIPSAQAFQQEMNCFYAGWPSQLVTGAGGKKVCTHPKAFKHYQAQSSLRCGPQELLCNPLLFGRKSKSEGRCASMATPEDRQRAFSQCETQFESQGANRFEYLKQLSAAEKQELMQTLGLVEKVCKEGSVGTQKNTPMCQRFSKKMESLRSKLGTLPAPIKNESCANCDVRAAQGKSQERPDVLGTQTGVISQIAEKMNSKLEEKDNSPRAVYQRIREQYLKGANDLNGECHPYSQLPPKEKTAFFIGLYSKELITVATPDYFRSNGKPQPSVDQVVSGLREALAWSAAEEQLWKERISSKPGPETSRELADLLTQRLETPQFKATTLVRAQKFLREQQIADCDFISEEAFARALESMKKAKPAPSKANIVTILDRKKDDLTRVPPPRRMVTVDLSNEKVLFHSEARFGDGDNRGLIQREDPRCSNVEGSNLSPLGLFVTTQARKLNSQPDAVGTFIRRPSQSKEERGLAIHQVSGGFTDAFFGENSIQRQFERRANSEAYLVFLRRSQNFKNKPLTFTDGCVGVPKEHMQKVNRLIEGGSFVYFHCQ